MMMMNQSVCRCCLLENPMRAYNLFDGSGSVRLELLQCVPSVNMAPDDGLPDIICETCYLRVREASDFRRRCEENDRELRKRYEDTNRVIEEALKLGIFDDVDEEVDGLVESLALADKAGRINVSAGSVTGELDSLEISMLNELLGEDYSSLPDLHQSVATNEEDAVISELLNRALSDHSLMTAASSSATNAVSPTVPVSAICYQNNQPLTDNTGINQEHQISLTNSKKLSKSDKSWKYRKSSGALKSLHPCTECEKKFTRNFQLKLHMISVHKLGDGLQYNCDECQKTFASRHSLNYHIKSLHSTLRPFACAQCSRTFVLRTQLASHERIHTGEAKPRIHECMECGKSWPTKSDLRTHMRSHDPDFERPFKCDRCTKSFFSRGHLMSHLLVHTGEKPFACAFCEKSYQSVGNLNNHLVRHHEHELGIKGQLDNMEI